MLFRSRISGHRTGLMPYLQPGATGRQALIRFCASTSSQLGYVQSQVDELVKLGAAPITTLRTLASKKVNSPKAEVLLGRHDGSEVFLKTSEAIQEEVRLGSHCNSISCCK